MIGERFENEFDAHDDAPEEAASLSLRGDLMSGIERIIDRSGWSRTEAAVCSGAAVPRIGALPRRYIDRFTLDELVTCAARLGQSNGIEQSDRADVA
jgi:predicted XRE-type DNA-binding protein